MRFSNNENINNDITRSGYFNSLKNSLIQLFNNSSFNKPLNNNHLTKTN